MAEFYIKHKDWNTVINYAKASVKVHQNAEVGGMMVMQKDKDGDYILKDPVILKQEVTGSTCEMDKEALALFYSKAHRKHKKKGIVRFVWWHSHGTMNAFWSSTDDKTILSNESDDFTVSLVVNIKSEHKLRIQYFQPLLCEAENEELVIVNGKTAHIPQNILKEVEEKCTKKQYHSTWRANKKGKVKDMLETQEQMDFNYGYNYGGYTSYNRETYSPDGEDGKVAYQTLITYMDGINSQYCAGEIKYDSWKRAVEGTNRQLITRKCDWKLEVLKEKDLDKIIYMVHPDEFVTRVHKLLGEKQ